MPGIPAEGGSLALGDANPDTRADGGDETVSRGSGSNRVDETGPASDSTETQIRTFLIADVRGYTTFTQEHGDEAAAKLAARFAEIVREHVRAAHGSVIELRGNEARPSSDPPAGRSAQPSICSSASWRKHGRSPISHFRLGSGSTRARESRSRADFVEGR